MLVDGGPRTIQGSRQPTTYRHPRSEQPLRAGGLVIRHQLVPQTQARAHVALAGLLVDFGMREDDREGPGVRQTLAAGSSRRHRGNARRIETTAQENTSLAKLQTSANGLLQQLVEPLKLVL